MTIVYSNLIDKLLSRYRLQMCLEDRIADLACSTGQKSILLCDRGLMDISAYMVG